MKCILDYKNRKVLLNRKSVSRTKINKFIIIIIFTIIIIIIIELIVK